MWLGKAARLAVAAVLTGMALASAGPCTSDLTGLTATSGDVSLHEPDAEIPTFEVEVVGHREIPGKAPISTSIITRTEIQRSGAQNLMDLLVREPGVWVSRQGGLGYGGNVTVRGFGGSPPTQVAVLVDGHPTQMGIMGHILPTSYLLDNIRRVEIVRGPSGAMYGNMAIGGAINIVTRGPRDESSRGSVYATSGSFGTTGQQLWITGHGGRLGYRCQVGQLETDGDSPYGRYDGDSYSIAADYNLNDTWDAVFRAQRVVYSTFDQTEVAKAFAAGRPAKFVNQDYDRADYNIEFKRQSADRPTSLNIFRTAGEHDFDDGFHSEDYGIGVSFSDIVPIARGSGRWGLEWSRHGGDILSPTPLQGVFSRTETAARMVVDYPTDGKTLLTAGFRYAAPSDLDSQFLPVLGFTRQLGDRWSWFGSARRGYRIPSFRELYLFGINNPELEPELAWQYETGVRRTTRAGARYEFSLFRIESDNLVALRPRPVGAPPGPPLQYANAGRATREGLEIGGRWPLGTRTAFYANYSYLDPGEIRDQTIGNKLAVGVDHRIGKWMLSGDLQYIDRLFDYDETNALVKVPAFTLVNLKAQRDLSGRAKLGIVVENLLDRTYRVDPAYPYPMPGRSIRLQLEKPWW